MRVMPPTRITSSIWLLAMPPSFRQFSTGPMLRSTRSPTSCSSFARLRVTFRCFGPLASAVMNGRLMSVLCELDSSHLAFSAASFSRCSAMGSLDRSMPWSFLNSVTSQSMTRWSKSSPPRCVSPLVAFTSNTPSPMSSTEMSNVPPPRSYTATFSSFFLSSP